MDSNLPKVESDTLSGFLYDKFGRVPGDGESIQTDELRLTIEQVIGRRIRRVRARKLSSPEEETHDNTQTD
jgi:CBS domain containing-hemolysin-like protein